MSAIAVPGPRVVRVERERQERAEAIGLFAVAFLVYLLIGAYGILRLHVLIGDAEARLAHAFFALHDRPAKLAAIGFYWPPLETLVLLPLAAFRALATSLWALPLTSSLFGAGLVVTVNRTLALTGIDRALRWLLVAGIALNPMIVFFAGNGMGEIVYLFFLALGAHFFLRWTIEPAWPELPLAAVAFALGTLARYEVALWLPLVAAGVALVHARRRDRPAALEASLLVLVVPTIFGILVWSFLNLEIVGRATYFLSAQLPASGSPDPAFSSLAGAVRDAFDVQARLFPAAYVLAAALAVAAWRLRRPTGYVVALFLLVNPVTTTYLIARSKQGFPLELRYNMRSIPLAAVALAWLLHALAPRARRIAAAAGVVLLAASVPVAGATMLTYEQHLSARITGANVRPASAPGPFLRGLLSGRPQDRVSSLGGSGYGLEQQRALARFVRSHVPGRDSILTDEGATFGIMLLDGHPDRYLDRIDVGDRRWLRIRNAPWGRVGYVLVSRNASVGDLVVAHYRALAGAARTPGFALVRAAGPYALYAVARHRPAQSPHAHP